MVDLVDGQAVQLEDGSTAYIQQVTNKSKFRFLFKEKVQSLVHWYILIFLELYS